MPNSRRDLPLAVATLALALLACNFGLVATPASPKIATPTAPPDAGTLVEAVPDGQRLSHPDFYWNLTLPSGWEVTYDRGFELHARGPGAKASLRLLSLVWATPEERPPMSQDFVEFWRNYQYGDVFPIYANGELVSETEINPGKFGGPYLLFMFDDPDADARYVQVYASGGGPSSIVLTLWSKRADFEGLESELQAIAESLTAVEAP